MVVGVVGASRCLNPPLAGVRGGMHTLIESTLHHHASGVVITHHGAHRLWRCPVTKATAPPVETEGFRLHGGENDDSSSSPRGGFFIEG